MSGFLIPCLLGGRRGGDDLSVYFLLRISISFNFLVPCWLGDRRSGGDFSVSLLVGVGASLLRRRTTMVFYFRIFKLALWIWCNLVSFLMMTYTNQGVVAVTVPRFP